MSLFFKSIWILLPSSWNEPRLDFFFIKPYCSWVCSWTTVFASPVTNMGEIFVQLVFASPLTSEIFASNCLCTTCFFYSPMIRNFGAPNWRGENTEEGKMGSTKEWGNWERTTQKYPHSIKSLLLLCLLLVKLPQQPCIRPSLCHPKLGLQLATLYTQRENHYSSLSFDFIIFAKH